ncbi:hypothetical protein IMSAGC005_03738 [Lachnospiraceae bacterium]|nr:hypothetical protein IMSAGC005_03738 [Lachnospiraceae bacterium]
MTGTGDASVSHPAALIPFSCGPAAGFSPRPQGMDCHGALFFMVREVDMDPAPLLRHAVEVAGLYGISEPFKVLRRFIGGIYVQLYPDLVPFSLLYSRRYAHAEDPWIGLPVRKDALPSGKFIFIDELPPDSLYVDCRHHCLDMSQRHLFAKLHMPAAPEPPAHPLLGQDICCTV